MAAEIHVFAIFDTQAQAFMRPIFFANVGVCLRTVSDEVNRAAADNMLHVHPEDFRLFHIGTWSESSGMFEQKGIPELVADCSSMLTRLSS